MTGSQGQVGRPRGFDVDEALDRAMLVFWRRGYEGTSLTELTQAMGIAKPSLYAAFGGKEELFRRVLQRYMEGPGSYVARALAEPTARAVAESILHGAARATTTPDDFGGCLSVQGALAASPGSQPAFDILVRWRNEAGEQVEERLRRAIADGDLPADADAERLARYLTTVVFGIAVQAADGAGREELHGVADTALAGWPR